MKQYTQKLLKMLIADGSVENVSNYKLEDYHKLKEKEKSFEQIGFAHGYYGICGKLLRGATTGKLYATVGYVSANYIF